MAARRISEGRVSFVPPAEVVRLAAAYYENEIQHRPDEEKQAFFLAAAQNGLGFDTLAASIDYAVSVVGFGAYERDYWPHIQEEARRIWSVLHPKVKKNPPQ